MASLCEEEKSEELWKIKSRKTWLTTKDLNTKFFHLSTVIRRRRNAIEFLKNDHEEWLSSRALVGEHIVAYFQNLFTTDSPVIPSDLEGLISPHSPLVENASICKIPSSEEIWAAVWDIGSHKSPNPDGMTGLFYKHFWAIFGGDLISMVTDFFCRGHTPTALNHSFIVLIPKSDHPMKIGHYRPISL